MHVPSVQNANFGDERYNPFNFISNFELKLNGFSIMSTLDQVLETALQLSYEQQEMLIKILQKRHHESRCLEIATDAKQTLADFRAGKFQHQSAENVIAALSQSLNEPDA